MHIFPDYENSILNISATLQDYLGTPNDIPKIKTLQDELARDYQTIILLVIDALGQRALEKHLPETSFLRTRHIQTLTSVFPSTTTCATTTLLSALYPAQHGWFAWALNFPELHRTIELFRNTCYYTGGVLSVDDFANTRLPYQNFFQGQPLIVRSKETMCNFFTQLNDACKSRPKFVYAYYSTLDSIMHTHGASSKPARGLIKRLDKRLETFIKKHPNTLVILTADHGQVGVADYIEIYKDPDIMACLAQNMSMDPRAAAFHIKPDMHDAFRAAFEKYSADFTLFKTADLIADGVFGPFTNDEYKLFLGDYIAIGTDTNKILIFAENHKQTAYRGHHTGTTPDEMLVPLILISSK